MSRILIASYTNIDEEWRKIEAVCHNVTVEQLSFRNINKRKNGGTKNGGTKNVSQK